MARVRSLRSFDWDENGEERFHEPKLARRRRLREKARDGKKAEETDRSGSVAHLERAAKRLKTARAEDRVLYVQQWNMDKALIAMRNAGVSGAVSNLCGTQRKRIGRER